MSQKKDTQKIFILYVKQFRSIYILFSLIEHLQKKNM